MFWLYIHSYRSFAYNDITKNCFLAEKELKYEKKNILIYIECTLIFLQSVLVITSKFFKMNFLIILLNNITSWNSFLIFKTLKFIFWKILFFIIA